MNIFDRLLYFFSSWRFAVLVIFTISFFALLMLAVLFIPESAGAASQFAEDFKIWCFGYDPATGQMEWSYVLMLLIQPLMMIGVIVLVWWKPLQEAKSVSTEHLSPYVGGAFLLACSLGVGLVSFNDIKGYQTEVNLDFPGERIRTHHSPLPFSLVNQDRQAIDLDQFKNRVVLITGVYTSCGYTCPLILGQAKHVLKQLSDDEQRQLSVIAITLDPRHDTPDVLKLFAEGQELESPLFNAVTGNPAYVNEVLDYYGFARSIDPETGIIDHENLFILIDRSGKIAFRFSLGEIQEAWLEDALHLLIAEEAVEV